MGVRLGVNVKAGEGATVIVGVCEGCCVPVGSLLVDILGIAVAVIVLFCDFVGS